MKLTNKKIICPNNLITKAKNKGTKKAAIVNAGNALAINSVQKAVELKLIDPIFIGDQNKIKEHAQKANWDISSFSIIHEPDENSTALVAAKLASEDKVQILIKGHIHTDVLMKAVLKRDLELIGKKRLSHIWHMTSDENDTPLIITDGALNVLPKIETKMHILKNAIAFANSIDIAKPKVAILSATEEILESMPSSMEANQITLKAKAENINAEIFGPLAFDNAISEKAAEIKGIKNAVAGKADILLVPNIETGNALVKMLIYFMGACAAGVVVGGKVPVVITSRADDVEARLASIAAAIVSL